MLNFLHRNFGLSFVTANDKSVECFATFLWLRSQLKVIFHKLGQPVKAAEVEAKSTTVNI